MESLFIYLAKSTGLIIMFYLAYFFLLRKETFFNSNRWFLLSGLITSIVLPLIFFTEVVWVNPSPSNYNWSEIQITAPIENDAFEINWYYFFGIIYGIGIVLFLTKFAVDFLGLQKILKNKIIQQQADFKFIDVKENIPPFSYFEYIVYNSTLYTDFELNNILEHEKVHCSQNHTLDVLISRLFCAVFWYNPFVWLYKKAVVQNLEFIADSEAVKNLVDKKAYQFTLLKITTHENCFAITNHFYQSLIKKRIVMLNKNQSNKKNSWKYAIILPLLGAFMLMFQVEIVAQDKVGAKPKSSSSYVILGFTFDNTCKDEVLEKYSKFAKKEKGIDLKFQSIKRDKNNKIIAISIFSDNNFGQKLTYKVDGKLPIKSIEIKFEKNKLGQNCVAFSDGVKTSANAIAVENGKKKGGFKAVVEFWTVDNLKENGLEYLVIINGKKQLPNSKIKIPLNEDILSEKIIKSKEAVKKYGVEAKNGALEIITHVKDNGKKREN